MDSAPISGSAISKLHWCRPEIGESEQLQVLSDSLCREDLKAAVFDNAKEAVGWLGKPGVVVQRRHGSFWLTHTGFFERLR